MSNTEDPAVVAVPEAEPESPAAPPRISLSPPAAGCLHRWVNIDKLPIGSEIANKVAGVLYVFHCERCLAVAQRNMKFS